MVRNCEKCGKANQPTRKFCIRCGSSLIKAPKKAAAAPAPAPQPEVVQPAAAPVAETPPVAEAPATTNDAWVKPSEVSKDRVRSGSSVERPKSEMEKAMEAFAKAETVGIDEEDGSGVVETRMLRASEVKELLEGPGMMAGGEEIPPPTMMEGSEEIPPEAAEMMMPQTGPTSSQIEESILGSKSAYVEKTPEPQPDPAPEVAVSPEISAEFATSSRYGTEGEPPVLEATTVEEPVAPTETGFGAVAPEPTPAQPSPAPVTPAPTEPAKTLPESDVDLVIACPDCGKVINVDMFEYPNKVYSEMGAARLSQARICIVQGKNEEAMKEVRMARAMYEKADDKKGLKEVLKLVESLARG